MRKLFSIHGLLRFFTFMKFLVLVSLAFTGNVAVAQNIKWNFDGGSGTDLPYQNVSHIVVSNLSQGNNYGTTTLINNSSPSSAYTGCTGFFNAGAATVSAGFAANTSTYFEFTLTPDLGYSVVVNSMNFGSRSTSTGPQAYAILSSIDSYTKAIVNKILLPNATWYFYENTGLSVSNSSAITFRIYGFNGAGSGHNTTVWRIDDMSVDVLVTPLQTYYRSRQSGNWATPSTWETSADNITWTTATVAPPENVHQLLIRPGQNVTVNSLVSLGQTIIEGTLELQTGGTLNINDGVGDDIIIPGDGILKITSSGNYSSSIQQSTGATINIAKDGKIEIGDGSSSSGDGYEAFATSNDNIWNDGAVFEYNSDKTFAAPGLIYFPNASSNIIPIFRVSSVNGTPGVGSTKDFHVYGILEVNTDLTFSGTGDKYFRNGIRGTATMTATGTGQIFLDGENAILDGSPLNIILTVSHPMKLINTCNVPDGAYIIISGSNIDNNLAGNVFTINGTLDVTDQGVANTNGSINLNGTFKTANSGGFSGSGSSIVSGNVTINAGSTVELYANGNQSLNKRTDFSNLILSGSGTKTPTASFSPTGTVTIKDDAIFDCRGRNIGDETTTGPTSTKLTMSGNSRLIVDTYGANPKMAGAYNFLGGVVEFRGSGKTAQTIRSENYQNIEVTGTNVGMSIGNIHLNSNGKFTVKNGGTFSINDNTITGSGDHTETVKIESGGTIECGNNLGFNGAVITPQPLKSSAINADIENIILEAHSTIDYSRQGDQPITNANGLIYQNLIISGNGNKTAPSDDLIIKGNFSKTGAAAFAHNKGTVIFNGDNVQVYSSVSPQVVFYNLTNENNSGLNINDSLSVYNQLLLENNSRINLSADISLLSNKDQTASIGQLGTDVNINYGNGEVIAERYINTNTIKGGHSKSWQLISTPTFGETIFDTWQEKGRKDISGYGTWITDKTGTANGFDGESIAPSMKYYDAGTNKWVGISGTGINLENEKGYLIFVRGDRKATTVNSPATPTVLRSRGKIYSPQSLPPVSTVSPGKFQSVGNPYASAIDFSKINSINIESAYTAWDPTLGGDYGVGGYQTISAATNYQAVPGHTSNYNTTSDYRNIQSGQAFFVFNYTAFPGSVNFTEACKVSGNQHSANRKASTDRAILFANLISHGIVRDGNAIVFGPKFSDKIDGDDALKVNSSGENFAIKRESKFLTVEAQKEMGKGDTIFYYLRNLSQQHYQISFMPENMHSALNAFLADQYLNTETPINLTDTVSVNFSITADKNSAMPERFFMIFRTSVSLAVSFLSMDAYLKNEKVRINWKVENETGIKNYEVEYSSDGINFSTIGFVEPKNKTANSYEFIDPKPKPGNNFYRIRIDKANGEIEYNKIVKVWITESKPSLLIYPNPVKNGIIAIQLINQPPGKYTFNLYNAIGQKVFSKEIKCENQDAIQSLLPGNNFSQGIYHLEIIKPSGERTTLKVFNK